MSPEQETKVKQIGNAVPVHTAIALVTASMADARPRSNLPAQSPLTDGLEKRT